jgi:hypothetical protein
MKLETSPQRREGAKIAKIRMIAASLSFPCWANVMCSSKNSQLFDFLCGTSRPLRLCGKKPGFPA